jgi:hypothetical protein
MSSYDRLEKLKQVLHPIEEKKVSMLCTAANNPLFFVSNTGLPTDPAKLPEVEMQFISAEE